MRVMPRDNISFLNKSQCAKIRGPRIVLPLTLVTVTFNWHVSCWLGVVVRLTEVTGDRPNYRFTCLLWNIFIQGFKKIIQKHVVRSHLLILLREMRP